VLKSFNILVAHFKTHYKSIALKGIGELYFILLKNPLLMLKALLYVHKMVEIHHTQKIQSHH
jgi:hypothetical protein